MKIQRLITMIVAIIVINSGYSQITITNNDMPQSNDTIRTSTTIIINGYDYTQSGEDYTWDLSDMVAVSQKVDTFINSTNTPPLYQVIFVPYFVANMASPMHKIDFVPGVEVTEIYNYYKNSDDKFEDVGFACTFNSVPLPVKYSEPDMIYDLPLNYGDEYSSNASFELSIPGLGFFSRSKDRSTIVDGWGTLITPYGAFETIRLKSEVIQNDSVYLDSLGYGFPINRQFIEYKWMGKEFGLPLLQITEEAFTATATYIDSVRSVSSSISENVFSVLDIDIYPNPAKDKFQVQFVVDQVRDIEISIYSILGVKVETLLSQRFQPGLQKYTFSINKNALPNGLYLLKISTGNNYVIRKLVIQ